VGARVGVSTATCMGEMCFIRLLNFARLGSPDDLCLGRI
jgi:hypothetical protein